MMKHRIVLVIAFVFLAFSVSAFAGEIKMEVPFSFIAANQILPPGNYTLTWDASLPNAVTLQDADGTKAVNVEVLTTMAERERPGDNPSVAFDEIGNKHILSQVWFPGQPGLMIASTSEKHIRRLISQ